MTQKARIPIPVALSPQYTEETIKASKGIIYKRQRVFNNHITSNDYEDSLIFDARLVKNILIQIINKHASNAILYQVLGCINPATDEWEILQPETALGASSRALHTISDPWAYIKLQVKSATSGQSGNVTAYISGRTP